MKGRDPDVPVKKLSEYFPFSGILGLFPCAQEVRVNRFEILYTATTHTLYRLANWSVLTVFLFTTRTSKSLFTLLMAGTLLKVLCTTLHVVMIIKKWKTLLGLNEKCSKLDFIDNRYRARTKIGVAFQLYIFLTNQLIQQRWLSLVRDIFSIIDVLSSFFIVMEFCMFLEVATKKLSRLRGKLVLNFYKTESVVDELYETNAFILSILSVFKRQLLLCLGFFAFEFLVASYDSAENLFSGEKSRAVCTVSYSVFCIWTLLLASHCCEQNRKQTRKFNFTLFKMMDQNEYLYKNEKLQLYAGMKSAIEFTACGYFRIDYPLVTSIISSTATYLVILIQLNNN